MAKNLVIVESPAKAKTISHFLGKDYRVLASMGHVRDLPKSQLGIDVEADFKPNYSVSLDKKKIIKSLRDELKKANVLWIATDEDREGEAIGWHLLQALGVKKLGLPVHRIVFHEITEGAIVKSLKSPRDIDMNLVNAQQARRVLDRLVGYELSPLLWKKIRYGLSAGRVQSVAVRLIVDREREILAFKPEEYWTIKGEFEKGDKKIKKDERCFLAELNKFKGKKLVINDEGSVNKILSALDKADYKIASVERKTVKRNPAPPFITSTLQQEASRKLNFSVKKTMVVAQQLYEGVKLQKKQTGLITYMRTDSVNLSDLALNSLKKLIQDDYGKEFALKVPRRFRSKKGAQEAHEAIRPVDVFLKPDEVGDFLTPDQKKLYDLIWKRTVACQMAEAVLDKVGVDVDSEKKGKSLGYVFRATGQTVKFLGFMKVYVEGRDEQGDEHSDSDRFLPDLEVGEYVNLNKLNHEQHFTKPPARYTEATLVKKLESEGIGRPSTYAPTIHTIVVRGYIEKEGRVLKPTDLAMVVTDLLVNHFSDIVDYKFTAEMEENLDKVEDGEMNWVPMIKNFYKPFHDNIEVKLKTLKKEDITSEESEEVCEKCGSKMVIKLGRFGKFLSCSNYPECKNAKPLNGDDEKGKEEDKKFDELRKKFAGKICEKCKNPMEVKVGRYGPFLGCSGYPECKNIQPIVVFSGVKCPQCESGQLIERRTKKGGRIFWGCNKFPKCKFATWNMPKGICKKCGGLLVLGKEDKILCVECDKKTLAPKFSKSKGKGKK